MSNRAWSDIAGKMVPKADMVAVRAYEASDLFQMDQWLSFEREWLASLEDDEAA